MTTPQNPMDDNLSTQPLPTEGTSTEETAVITEPSTTSTSWRHPVNTGHLVMGVAFAGILGIWALFAGDVVNNDDLRWLMPLPWVLAGAVGLAAATWANLRSRREREARL